MAASILLAVGKPLGCVWCGRKPIARTLRHEMANILMPHWRQVGTHCQFHHCDFRLFVQRPPMSQFESQSFILSFEHVATHRQASEACNPSHI